MRYSSVEWTLVVPVKARRRLGFFVCSRWRLPARERRTFPPAVILNRLAADFLVLMPFGRLIKSINSFQKERAIYGAWRNEARGNLLATGAVAGTRSTRVVLLFWKHLRDTGGTRPCHCRRRPVEREAGV